MSVAVLVHILIVLVILGLIVYVVETYIPMDAMFRMVIRVILAVAVCIWLLSLLGVVHI